MNGSVRDSRAPEDPADELETEADRPKVIVRPSPAEGAKRLPLPALRIGVGKSEDDVAAALSQPIAKLHELERSGDALVSELRRYAEAIGARCEVAFVWDATGQRIQVELRPDET